MLNFALFSCGAVQVYIHTHVSLKKKKKYNLQKYTVVLLVLLFRRGVAGYQGYSAISQTGVLCLITDGCIALCNC